MDQEEERVMYLSSVGRDTPMASATSVTPNDFDRLSLMYASAASAAGLSAAIVSVLLRVTTPRGGMRIGFTGYAVDSTDHNMLIASTYY